MIVSAVRMQRMPPVLRWHRLTWDEFLIGATAYRDVFSGKSREDHAYLRCRNELLGRSMRERAAKARIIVWFCNNWACHLSAHDAPPMVSNWIKEHAAHLEALGEPSILDDQMPAAVPGMFALYLSLMDAGQATLHNMSPAAASKILHQLVPTAFVPWDRAIMRFAEDYGDFTLEMHELGCRLVADSPYTLETVEAGLQDHLGYAVRKSFAKYLDEYNWYVMVGAGSRT